MSTHCFKRLLGTLLVGAAFSLAGTSTAFADNPASAKDSGGNYLFELDGDSIPGNAPNAFDPFGPGHDWNQLTSPAPGNTGIVVDAPNPKVFTQGSKDTADIAGWAWRSGSSPPKADIQDAYASAFTDSNNDLMVYFGLDRLSVNGTTSAGFWFFTKAVCPLSNGTFGEGDINPGTGLCSNAAAPLAHHHNGDTLVTVNYTNGGATGTINVFVWSGDANGTLLQPLASTNTGNLPGLFCAPGSGSGVNSATATACGITNSEPTTVGWNPPDGSPNLLAGQFYEGGIDTTSLTGGQHCFASFMATSRSSATVNSETKNFVLGNFPVCKIDVGKACDHSVVGNPSVNAAGTGIDTVFKVTIKNSGLGPVSNVTLAEDSTDLTTGSATCTINSITDENGVTTNTSTTFTGSSSVTIGGTTFATTTPVPIVAALDGGKSAIVEMTCTSTTNPYINKVFAQASSGSGSQDLTAVHETNNDPSKPPLETCQAAVSPAMDVSKICNPGTASLLGDGTFTFKVCNDFTITSKTKEELIGITVTDSQSGTVFNNYTLAPGATKTVSKCYDPTVPNVGLTPGQTSVGVLKFMDQITEVKFAGDISQQTVDLINGAKDANGNTIVLPSAQCPLCPAP